MQSIKHFKSVSKAYRKDTDFTSDRWALKQKTVTGTATENVLIATGTDIIIMLFRYRYLQTIISSGSSAGSGAERTPPHFQCIINV